MRTARRRNRRDEGRAGVDLPGDDPSEGDGGRGSRLFVMPGACSLASHVALERAAEFLPAGALGSDVVVLERGGGGERAGFAGINPLGTVPTLVTPDGGVLLESVAVLLHLADLAPGARLAPEPGGSERDRLHMLLSMMVTTGHGAFQALWRPERFVDGPEAIEPLRRMAARRAEALLGRLDVELGSREWLVGDGPTVADLYLFVLGRWGLRLARPTTTRPALWRLVLRVAGMGATKRAMDREGIGLHGPADGLG